MTTMTPQSNGAHFRPGERVRFRDTERTGTIVRRWEPWDQYRVRWDEGTSLVEASNVWVSDLTAVSP